MADTFQNYANGIESPARAAVALSVNNGVDLAVTTRAIYTGSGGTLVCQLEEDTANVTFTNVPPGSILPIRVRQVNTGTTITGLIGLD